MDLLERDGETAVLSDAFMTAAGGSGRLIVIEAVPGMGKTVLLGEASRMCRAAGLTLARARGAELEREFTFGTVRQLLDPFLAGAAQERDRRADSRRDQGIRGPGIKY